MKKLILLITAALILSGCGTPIPSRETHDKENVKLDFLFEHDGCKMYRFIDNGRAVYWSDCSGKVQDDFETRSGKSTVTHHEETITTK